MMPCTTGTIPVQHPKHRLVAGRVQYQYVTEQVTCPVCHGRGCDRTSMSKEEAAARQEEMAVLGGQF